MAPCDFCGAYLCELGARDSLMPHKINRTDTATALRLLAKKFDDGADLPDFVFILTDGDLWKTDYHVDEDPRGMIGGLFCLQQKMAAEIEEHCKT